MKFIPPIVIDDTTLASSSVAEDTSPAWNIGTTYALDDYAHDPATHRRYQSLIGSNLGNALTDAAKWLDVGPTNKWAMFDQVNGTYTEDAAEIAVEIAPTGRVDSVALLGLQATAVNVTCTVDAVEVYNEDFDLSDFTGITDFYSYCFAERRYRRDLIIVDLPSWSGMTLAITVTGSTVRVGTCIVGQFKALGETAFGMRVGINDRSVKSTNDLGQTSLIERAYSKRGNFTVHILGQSAAEVQSKVDWVCEQLADYRATACVWIGSERYGATAIYGFYTVFEVEIPRAMESICTLSIEGLT